ncbi:MAG: tRNA pseudouridine(65) synthase TruC [Candidatus Eremiobacteraeota bacterium]|nr:tRNA pseudouridine(65) synthase TruC [Candidatus Eremiobacteraeota bacterium]
MNLEVLYQDDWLCAILKPAGVLVHPTRGADDRVTCLSLVRDMLGQWVYPIHRLDRGTSGVLVFPLSSEDAREVGRAFAEHRVEKVYYAVTRGWVEDGVQASELDGKTAETSYRCLARTEVPIPVDPHPSARYSLVEARPSSGVYHQIRRHLRRAGHPILGDTRHGHKGHNQMAREHFGFERLALHAGRLVLPHPRTGQPLCLEAPTTPDLRQLFYELKLDPIAQGDLLGR